MTNCDICENTCEIQIAKMSGEQIVFGHQCLRGFAFANRTLGHHLDGNLIQRPLEFNSDYLLELLKQWKIKFKSSLSENNIQGSPERSAARMVVQDIFGKAFLLEQINSLNIDRKSEIAGILEKFNHTNLPVINYIKTRNNLFLAKFRHKYWMLSPFIDGTPLDRKTYWKENWRGQAAAEFLMDLHKISSELNLTGESFNLIKYIDTLIPNIRKFSRDIYNSVVPVYDYIREKLYPHYNALPVTFCHGDPHPLNMIWGDRNIYAVIDWEFCGIKPEIYDIALIIGCVASENPNALFDGFLNEFIKLSNHQLISNKLSIQMLPYFVVALRFAWLSEWLRKKDEEMIKFEIGFMQFLTEKLPTVISV